MIEQHRWQIYSIIIFGIIGCIGVVVYIIRGIEYPIDKIQDDSSGPITNDIVARMEDMPSVCQDSLTTLDCIINSSLNTGDKESLHNYYTQLIAQRNTIIDLSQLEKSCKEQYHYVATLQLSGYQSLIKSCL